MPELSFSDVGEILAIVDRLDCESFHLEYGDVKISISQSGTGAGLATSAPMPPIPPTQAAAHASQPHDPRVSEPQAGDAEGWEAVTAAMAGTFYRGPEPGKPPWVSVGDHVEAGQTVCVLEVMKLFTELKAERPGTVVRIDAEDGAVVEYQQPLVWIDPR